MALSMMTVLLASDSIERIAQSLTHELQSDSPEMKQPEEQDSRSQLESLISKVRETRALFIHFEDLEQKSIEELESIRSFFISVFLRQSGNPKAKPVHFYISSPRKYGNCPSWKVPGSFKWRSWVELPYKPEYVTFIRKKLGHSYSPDEKVNEAADSAVSRLSAGIPYLVWEMTTSATVLGLKISNAKRVEERIQKLSQEVAYRVIRNQNIRMMKHKPELMEEFLTLHFHAITGTPVTNPAFSQNLPIFMNRTHESRKWLVQTALYFVDGFSNADVLLLDTLMALFQGHRDWGEHDKATQIVLFWRLYAQTLIYRKLTSIRLHQIFPFLEGTGLEDVDLPLYKEKTFETLSNLMASYAADDFEAEEPLVPLKEGGPSRGRVLNMTDHSSSLIHSFRLHPGLKRNTVRLVDLQLKHLAGDCPGTSWADLFEQSIAKARIAEKEGKSTLHIVSSSETHQSVQSLMPDSGVLVLKEEMASSFLRKLGKECAAEEHVIPENITLVILSPEKANEWMSPLNWAKTKCV